MSSSDEDVVSAARGWLAHLPAETIVLRTFEANYTVGELFNKIERGDADTQPLLKALILSIQQETAAEEAVEQEKEFRARIFDALGTWEDLQEACAEMWFVSPFTFTRDFGPWKAGERISSLAFLVPEMELVEYGDDGQRVASCEVLLLTPNVRLQQL